ncbi:hypothetical protein ACFS27_09720 [Promicromonospora vindobonensis]|uniref:Uncharacterized protein n=1 Tax=Promicromonospora vindobonensis TaxID=195748 RepID=A0ABW5VRD9_9MICO
MSEGTKDAVSKAAAAGLGALAGAAVAGPAGAVLGATAGSMLEPVMRRVWDELASDSQASAEQVLVEASSYSDKTPDEFADSIRQDEVRRLLGGIAFAAGSKTRNKDKIRGLGRALADGVLADDDARLDETHLILGAMDDLEAPHITVLDFLVNYYPGRVWQGEQTQPPRRVKDDSSTHGRPDTRPRWKVFELEFARPGFRGSLQSLLGTLQRHGLAVPEQDVKNVLDRYQRDAKTAAMLSLNSTGPGPSEAKFRTENLETRWSATGLGAHVLNYILAEQPTEPEA